MSRIARRAVGAVAVAASVVDRVLASPARRRTRCRACRLRLRRRSTASCSNGKPLAYTARAGVLPIRLNETGEPRGYIFFVSYTVDHATEQSTAPTHVRVEWRSRRERIAGAPERARTAPPERRPRMGTRPRRASPSKTTRRPGSTRRTSCSSIPSARGSAAPPSRNTPATSMACSATLRRPSSSCGRIALASTPGTSRSIRR